MIQVLERCFEILELMSPDRDISLNTLTQLTRLNRGTLCNILRTLGELGYVVRSGQGAYRLSAKIRRLHQVVPSEKLLQRISSASVEFLYRHICHGAVAAAAFQNGILTVLAQKCHPHFPMPDTGYPESLLGWNSAAGRAVWVMLSDEQQTALLREYQSRSKEHDLQPESHERVKAELERIRSRGYAFMNYPDLSVCAYAMPFLDRYEKVCGSIDLLVPSESPDSPDGKRHVEKLKRTARMATRTCIELGLHASDWMK